MEVRPRKKSYLQHIHMAAQLENSDIWGEPVCCGKCSVAYSGVHVSESSIARPRQYNFSCSFKTNYHENVRLCMLLYYIGFVDCMGASRTMCMYNSPRVGTYLRSENANQQRLRRPWWKTKPATSRRALHNALSVTCVDARQLSLPSWLNSSFERGRVRGALG